MLPRPHSLEAMMRRMLARLAEAWRAYVAPLDPDDVATYAGEEISPENCQAMQEFMQGGAR